MPASAQLLVILVAMLGFWAIVMRPARNQQYAFVIVWFNEGL